MPHRKKVPGERLALWEMEHAGGDPPFPSAVISLPPVGYCKVTNMYVDPDNGKIILLWDDKKQEA